MTTGKLSCGRGRSRRRVLLWCLGSHLRAWRRFGAAAPANTAGLVAR